MSRYSIAQRTPLINSMFAGLACAITLTLTAGPALADSGEFGRVEVQGRVLEAPVRYDVHASCDGIEGQLQSALESTWLREQREGTVKVQFVMENGEISNVGTRGFPGSVTRDVRNAVSRLSCGQQAAAGAQIYRFNVEFVDPASARARDARMASANGHVAIRVASLDD